MIRRLNFTGRRKIARSSVRIHVRPERAGRVFDANLALDGLGLPPEAAVYVEAYYRSAYQRFDFGTIGRPVVPAERRLNRIPVRNPLFRVKAVLEIDGAARILAAADRVVPEQSDRDNAMCQSLLPVEYEDLGDRIWSLDLSDDEWPRLRLNRRFNDEIPEAARSGPEFLTLVYPEVLRSILSRAIEDGAADPSSGDDDWRTLWVRFACSLGCPPPPHDFGLDAEEWIDSATNAFCAAARVPDAFKKVLEARSE